MKRSFALFLILLPGLAVSYAQINPSADDRAPKLVLKMTVSKQVLKAGETLTVRFQIKNVGRFPVWVPESWGRAGGGVPGFFVNVKQVNGKKRKCSEWAGDGGLVDDSDSPELLRKHYVLLDPQSFVGWQTRIEPCMVANPGQYKIEGAYWPYYWYLSRKKPIDFSSETYGVVEHAIEAEPVLITVN